MLRNLAHPTPKQVDSMKTDMVT